MRRTIPIKRYISHDGIASETLNLVEVARRSATWSADDEREFWAAERARWKSINLRVPLTDGDLDDIIENEKRNVAEERAKAAN